MGVRASLSIPARGFGTTASSIPPPRDACLGFVSRSARILRLKRRASGYFGCERAMADLLLSSDARGVVTLTLNRPERHNAFDDAVVALLTASFRQLAENEAVRILVIRGAGRN